MATDQYDPFKDESLGQKRPRKPPVRVDWRGIARRMAAGETPAEIAAGLGLPEDRIWRHLNRSPKFLKDLDQESRRQRLLAKMTFRSVGPAAAYARLGAPADDAAARWLAEQTGLAGGDAGDGTLAGQLRETARSTRQPRVVRPRVSAATKAEYAALRAAAAEFERPKAGAPDEASGEPERTSTNPNEPEPTSTNLNEPERTRMNRNEPARTAPGHAAFSPRRTVVDLDGPDLARLKAQGLLPP